MNSLFETQSPYNGVDGEAQRDRALNLLRVRRSALIRECSRAALRVVLDQGEVTADDIRPFVEIPKDIKPVFVGTVFRDLADAQLIRFIGVRNSKRPEAHARSLKVWQLADRAAAEAWLIANPPIPITN